MNPGPHTVSSHESTSGRHPIFWFEEGTLVLEVDAVMFRVHHALLTRHSPFLSSLEGKKLKNGSDSTIRDRVENSYMKIDPERKVTAPDLEVLLQHLYHDISLSPDTPFPRIASVVRVSSTRQLDFPKIHQIALRYFTDLFPSGPIPFLHPRPLEEALDLATTFNVTSIQKGLLYSLVTSTNFDTEDASSDGDLAPRALSDCGPEKAHVQGNTDPLLKGPEVRPQLATVADSPSGPHKYVLAPLDSQRCLRLMTQFIEHFSPILFTPPATPHMACTDVFADTWMQLVIQPAIDDEGVYKPLETLERIKRVDWAQVGLCSACVLEKNTEWTEEQQTLWGLMDQWIGL
ncbi:hypothetical protein C8R43DRAFT_1085290 [Mycena crocata]|nr:hypothetical protein C8R43DRAFT_1085290 [Mycena crocata]